MIRGVGSKAVRASVHQDYDGTSHSLIIMALGEKLFLAWPAHKKPGPSCGSVAALAEDAKLHGVCRVLRQGDWTWVPRSFWHFVANHPPCEASVLLGTSPTNDSVWPPQLLTYLERPPEVCALQVVSKVFPFQIALGHHTALSQDTKIFSFPS